MTAASGDLHDSSTAAPASGLAAQLALVVLGATLGTAARAALTAALPDDPALPLTTTAINVAGAFCLGLLLESLARRGADEGGRRRLRLLAGTGFLGGFTTYSTFAVQLAQQLLAGDPGAAMLTAGITTAVGLAGAALGIATGAALARRPR